MPDISLSPDEFSRLLKLVYLGEFMANVDLNDDALDDERKAFADLRSKLFGLAEENGKPHYAFYDLPRDEWFASRGLEEDAVIRKIVQEYDEHVFWEELSDRLSSRDLMDEYGKDTIKNMEDEHYARAQDTLLDYYDREFDTHGVDRLHVRE